MCRSGRGRTLACHKYARHKYARLQVTYRVLPRCRTKDMTRSHHASSVYQSVLDKYYRALHCIHPYIVSRWLTSFAIFCVYVMCTIYYEQGFIILLLYYLYGVDCFLRYLTSYKEEHINDERVAGFLPCTVNTDDELRPLVCGEPDIVFWVRYTTANLVALFAVTTLVSLTDTVEHWLTYVVALVVFVLYTMRYSLNDKVRRRLPKLQLPHDSYLYKLTKSD